MSMAVRLVRPRSISVALSWAGGQGGVRQAGVGRAFRRHAAVIKRRVIDAHAGNRAIGRMLQHAVSIWRTRRLPAGDREMRTERARFQPDPAAPQPRREFPVQREQFRRAAACTDPQRAWGAVRQKHT